MHNCEEKKTDFNEMIQRCCVVLFPYLHVVWVFAGHGILTHCQHIRSLKWHVHYLLPPPQHTHTQHKNKTNKNVLIMGSATCLLCQGHLTSQRTCWLCRDHLTSPRTCKLFRGHLTSPRTHRLCRGHLSLNLTKNIMTVSGSLNLTKNTQAV